MSTYETTYCNTTTDLLFIEPYLGQYDHKRVLPSNWTAASSSLYYLYDSGYVSQLYKDGAEMTSVSDVANADNEFLYDSAADLLSYYLASTSASALNSSVFEASTDWATLKSEAVKRASDFIRTYLPFPIYPNKGVGTADASGNNFPEIIVRSTATMAIESLIRPYDPEKADLIKSNAINDNGTGWLDMLRTGQISLYSSESESRHRGILREVSINANTTGAIVDVRGRPSTSFDIIKIIVTAGGTVTAGSANTSVKFSSYVRSEDGLKIQAKTQTEAIDCYWQDVGHNMEVRFSQGVFTTNDEWELEVSGSLDQRFTPVKSISMSAH